MTLTAKTLARISKLNRAPAVPRDPDEQKGELPETMLATTTPVAQAIQSALTPLELDEPKTATAKTSTANQRAARKAERKTGEESEAASNKDSDSPAHADKASPDDRTSTRELPAGREVHTASGSFWRIDTPIEQLWRGGKGHVRRGTEFLRVAVQTQEDPHPELAALASDFPDRTLFLDLETCGFAGSIVFLVGLLHFEDGQLKLSQLLARNYAEEKAVLHGLWAIAGQSNVLSTFNGKSFDWPCVHDRSTLHHLGRDDRHLSSLGKPQEHTAKDDARVESVSLDEPMRTDATRPDLVHCDLLHHSRRKWKDALPNCRLQTLERYICGRRRYDDIPGSAIPAAYHQFVRTGDAWEIRSILHHNALDLITLLQLSMRVVE